MELTKASVGMKRIIKQGRKGKKPLEICGDGMYIMYIRPAPTGESQPKISLAWKIDLQLILQ